MKIVTARVRIYKQQGNGTGYPIIQSRVDRVHRRTMSHIINPVEEENRPVIRNNALYWDRLHRCLESRYLHKYFMIHPPAKTPGRL